MRNMSQNKENEPSYMMFTFSQIPVQLMMYERSLYFDENIILLSHLLCIFISKQASTVLINITA